jgi:plasmid stabilization system protein ParE
MNDSAFKVLWTESAVQDLEEILAYIAADSPTDARKMLRRLQGRAASLESMPGRGRVVPELAAFGFKTWRELVVKPYRVVYRIERKTVYVLLIVDSRRDLEELLLKRLLREG